MIEAYKDAALTLSFVKKWIVMFKNGRTDLEDLPRSGGPINEDYIDEVRQYIEDYPFSSAQNISSALGIHAKWVPPVLTECQIESWFYLNYYTENAYLHEGEHIVLPKRLISDQKIMIFSAFSASGLVLLEMLPPKTRFNSQYMCEVILPKLKEAAQTELGIRKNSNILIHLDNAKPHNSKIQLAKYNLIKTK